MQTLVFFEKPGCISNAKQKKLLSSAGISFTTENILEYAWDPLSLAPFFSGTPVVEWINPNAPAVKDGEIDPTQVTEHEALAMMVNSPILIRRPLIQVGNLKWAGFDLPYIAEILGVSGDYASTQGIESCSHPHKGECD
ncbi:ArsC/Spx/MgsR family protein [Teredinibacter turnerae]|uniref:ArsC/Spx/MgsR family protein n=1 Tax=Teredinibacter turnerae TaxID=2426 RepID=UPI00037D3CB0|nr:ArsC/Spx/MgsR family protein [Teredinibacter turnerae]